MTLDSFWIGSVLVVVLTGLYTVLGGMRAVAYTEALQTIILIIGSALVTFFGLQGGRRLATELSERLVGSEMFNLWKPVVPPGGLHWDADQGIDASGEVVGPGLVFQRQLSLAGHAVLRTDHRAVVLVHRPVHRAAGAGRARTKRRPAAARSSPPF